MTGILGNTVLTKRVLIMIIIHNYYPKELAISVIVEMKIKTILLTLGLAGGSKIFLWYNIGIFTVSQKKSVCGTQFDTSSEIDTVGECQKLFDLTRKQRRWNACVSWREDIMRHVVACDKSYLQERKTCLAWLVVFNIVIPRAVVPRKSVSHSEANGCLTFGFPADGLNEGHR
jgi:hypothetical protein